MNRSSVPSDARCRTRGIVLTLRPTDLTRLPSSNGGTFPTIRVVMLIDGRELLVSHGSPMPIYGEFFEGRDVAMKAPNGMPILTSKPVVDLVVWLEGPKTYDVPGRVGATAA